MHMGAPHLPGAMFIDAMQNGAQGVGCHAKWAQVWLEIVDVWVGVRCNCVLGDGAVRSLPGHVCEGIIYIRVRHPCLLPEQVKMWSIDIYLVLNAWLCGTERKSAETLALPHFTGNHVIKHLERHTVL